MQKGDFLIFIKAPRWLDDWSCPVTELFKRLDCTATGLSSDQARARLSAAPVPTRSRPQGFMRLAGEPLVLILIAGALVALYVGDWLDAAIGWCIVLLSAVLSAWYENRASTAVEQL
jgi:Mg2+-importing ATPase